MLLVLFLFFFMVFLDLASNDGRCEGATLKLLGLAFLLGNLFTHFLALSASHDVFLNLSQVSRFRLLKCEHVVFSGHENLHSSVHTVRIQPLVEHLLYQILVRGAEVLLDILLLHIFKRIIAMLLLDTGWMLLALVLASIHTVLIYIASLFEFLVIVLIILVGDSILILFFRGHVHRLPWLLHVHHALGFLLQVVALVR